MSDNTAAPEPTTAPATPAVNSAEAPGKNTVGLVALIIAGVGALFAILPPTNAISWLVLLAALIVGIVGLTRKGQKKATSVIAVVLSVVFWVVSVIVGIGLIASGVADAINSPPSASEPDAGSESGGTDEPGETSAGIGDSVTVDGVTVTLSSVEVGVAPPNDFIVSEVRGELVAVTMSMNNGSDDAVAISTSSVQGFIGSAEYEAAAVFGSDSGEWYIFEEINPGLTANFVAYFDVPAGTPLEQVVFQTSIFGGEAVFTLQ